MKHIRVDIIGDNVMKKKLDLKQEFIGKASLLQDTWNSNQQAMLQTIVVTFVLAFEIVLQKLNKYHL